MVDPWLKIHLFTCFFMTGLIWIVQLVHYPSYHFVDKERFRDFEKFHIKAISLIVMPIMNIELLSGSLLLYLDQSLLPLLNFILNIAIYLTTYLWSVPCHQKLEKLGKDIDVINKLVQTNWPRTIIWTLRSSLLIYYFWV